MKNLLEKLKNLTSAEKIRYGVISLLVFAIAVTLTVTIAMNRSEAEEVELPEIEHANTDTDLNFDSEIIIDVGTDVEAATDADTETESTTEESEPSEETTETTVAATESNTEKETTKETEKVTEKEPSDPQSTPSKDEPKPAETTKAQTQAEPSPIVTTETQKTPAPKPAETTAKQTEAVTKPAVTTKPAETTKPVETTKPTPVTKPEESKPQQAGQFVLKDKKYEYEGANVSILHVENKSKTNYTITITGTFKDESGNVLKKESKTFNGFPAEWSNYFLFQPGIKYESVSWDIKGNKFSGETFAQCWGPIVNTEVFVTQSYVDSKGDVHYYPVSPDCKLEAVVCARGIGNYRYDGNELLMFQNQGIILDSNDNIITITPIRTEGNQASTGGEDSLWGCSDFVCSTGYLYADRDKYVIPEHIKNLTVISTIISAGIQ